MVSDRGKKPIGGRMRWDGIRGGELESAMMRGDG